MAASPALFAAAAAFLPSAPSAAALPQPAKLRLYALFKLASAPPSAPPTPPGPRPAFWSVEQRAKWDAWSAAAAELEADDDGGRARARTAYVELARSVGFDGACPSVRLSSAAARRVAKLAPSGVGLPSPCTRPGRAPLHGRSQRSSLCAARGRLGARCGRARPQAASSARPGGAARAPAPVPPPSTSISTSGLGLDSLVCAPG